MPHPRPIDVVIGAPIAFDITKVLDGQPDSEMPLEKLVDAYHAQVGAGGMSHQGVWDASSGCVGEGLWGLGLWGVRGGWDWGG